MNRQRGLTLIEMVVAMVVAAILFSFAKPSVVGLGDAERVMDEKAKEAKIVGGWQKGIVEYERSWDGDTVVGGSAGAGRDESKAPTLGRIAGYSPPGIPAPAELPLQKNYIWTVGMWATNNSPVWETESARYVDCDSEEIKLKYRYAYNPDNPSFNRTVTNIQATKTYISRAVPMADQPPRCTVYRTFRNNSTGKITVSLLMGIEGSKTGIYYKVGPELLPMRANYTCAHHSASWGVPYVLAKRVNSGPQAWYSYHGVIGQSESEYWNSNVPVPTQAEMDNSYCRRDGPAPPVAEEVMGDVEMAADFSGWCVVPGRKIPTYKDRNRTQPTTAHTDPVMSVGETVDDATNC